MPGFIYYLPRESKNITLAEAREAGLAYAFEERCPFTPRGCEPGPDGGRGVVFGDDNRVSPGLVKYVAAKQKWLKVAGTDAWVGFWRDQRPGPDDLLRPESERLPGHRVRLWDGNDWEVPVARGADEADGSLVWTVAVPQLATRDSDGKWVSGDVVAKYEAIWGLATEFGDAWSRAILAGDEETEPDEAATVRFDYDGLIEGAVLALSQNYAIGPAEVDLLGLLSHETAQEILLALIDWPTQVAVQKKIFQQVDGSPSPGGSPDTSPVTDPA